MKIRRNSVLKHTFLIVITVFILFPLFWVISTSLRRDNAAFSTKLISSRMTLQHYVDLLLPPKNIPVKISEMKKIANISGEYKNKDIESLKSDIGNNIASLGKELANTEIILAKTENDMKVIESKTKEISQTYEKDFLSKKSGEILKIEDNIESLIRSDVYATYLKYKFISGIVSFRFENLYAEFLKKHFSESGVKLLSLQSRIDDLVKDIDNSLDGFFTLNKNAISQEDKDSLITAFEEFEAEYYALNFKYSKWNREILIKYLNKTGKTIEDETVSENWNTLVDNLKSRAKEIEEITGEGSEYIAAMLKDYESASNEIESTLKEYSDLNSSIAQNNLKLDALESQTEKTNLSIMDGLQKESILLEQLKSNDVFIREGLNIIDSLLAEEEKPGADPAFIKKIEGMLSNANEIRDMMGAYSFDKNKEAEFAKDSVYRLISLSDEIKSRAGYGYLEDALTVINNSFLLLKPILEDLNGISSQIAEYSKEISVLTSEIQNLKEENENIKGSITGIEQEYSNALKIKNASQLFLNYFVLYGYLETAKNMDGIFNYLNYLKKTAEDNAVSLTDISIHDKEFLDNTLNLESAVAMVDTFNNQNNSIKAGIAECRTALSEFEKRVDYYLALKLSGSPISIVELNSIESLTQNLYQSFSADLNRIGRKSIDFTELDSDIFASIGSNLKNIDKNIFDIMQIWMKKPDQQFMKWLLNTIVISILTAALTVIICALGAYPFSRMRFKGRKNGLLVLLLVQMFPTFMGMIALYSLLRYVGGFIPSLGLDTLGGLTFVYLGNIAFNMWLLKGYFDTIPDTLEESAMIDGATRFQTFWKIVMPLATPILAVVFLLVFMSTFQEFILARIVLQSPENYTFAVGLQSFAYGPYQMEWGLFTAAAMIGAIPMLILFLFMQKYLVSGLTQGAVKG